MSHEISRRGDSSLHISQTWKYTSSVGSILASVFAFVMEYPIVTMFIAIFVGLSTLPVVLFMSFVLHSLLFTILGFALIEGTLLMFAISLLSAVIFFVFFVSVCVTVLVMLTWTSATIGFSLAQKMQGIVQYLFPHWNLGLDTSPSPATRHPKSDWCTVLLACFV